MPKPAPLSRPVSTVNLSSRLGTPEIPSNVHEKRVANLPISKNLKTLESTLNTLLESISRYAPDLKAAEELVKTQEALNVSVDEIIKHQESGLEIDGLEQQSSKLDQTTKDILKGLSECRQKLSALPSLDKALSEQRQMNENKIPADELLQYAMKLAKFTTAPPTFDSSAIGPNNFIWPAEDSLRRGMLAVASLNAAKLTGKEEVSEEKKEEVEKAGASPQQRRGSFNGSYGDADADGDADVLEDLDLFDPDEL